MFRIRIRRLIERARRITTEGAVEQNFHLIRNVLLQTLFGRYLELVHILLFLYFRHGQGTTKYLNVFHPRTASVVFYIYKPRMI